MAAGPPKVYEPQDKPYLSVDPESLEFSEVRVPDMKL
jgi:hypothetical protein